MFEVTTRSALMSAGWTSRLITAAVRSGQLIRARQNQYLAAEAPASLVQAIRVGGRLGCVSLLQELGVFVFENGDVHVHMERGDSRMRSSDSRSRPLAPRRERRGVVLHWRRLVVPPLAGHVSIIDALIHAVLCQPWRHAVATLDSALNLDLITEVDLAEIFAHLPRTKRWIRPLLDGRAQAGTETLVRLMALALGCTVELQVHVDGVGFVDLVIDKWLAVECDSKQFHNSWRQRVTDYRRDQALAAAGYLPLRLVAEDILYRPELVLAALKGLLRSTRRP